MHKSLPALPRMMPHGLPAFMPSLLLATAAFHFPTCQQCNRRCAHLLPSANTYSDNCAQRCNLPLLPVPLLPLTASILRAPHPKLYLHETSLRS